MPDELVRVQRAKSDDYETIPRSQVPPHYIFVHIQEIGDCWLDPALLDDSRDGKFCHGPLTDAIRDEIRRFMRVFDCLEMTLEKWESNFRKDRTPWRELAIWDSWTAIVERFTDHLKGDDELTRIKRHDVANLVLALGNRPPPSDAKLGAYGTLSAARVRDILAAMRASFRHRNAVLPRYRALMRSHILATPFPAEATVHALMDESNWFNLSSPFDTQEYLGAADLIVARDVETGTELLVYGEPLAARINAGEPVGDYRSATVTLDINSEELTWLRAAIMALKDPVGVAAASG